LATNLDGVLMRLGLSVDLSVVLDSKEGVCNRFDVNILKTNLITIYLVFTIGKLPHLSCVLVWLARRERTKNAPIFRSFVHFQKRSDPRS